MSPELRPNFKKEIPAGQELISLAANLSHQALVETFPKLKESPYRKRLVATNFEFEPVDQIYKREELDRPQSNSILIPALSLSGVEEDFINQRWSRISNFNPSHQKSPGETLYVAKEAFPGFSSSRADERRLNAVGFGDYLIITSMALAPTVRNLPLKDYKDIAITGTEDFMTFASKSHQEKINPQKIEEAKNMIRSLFDNNVSIMASGAEIKVAFDGQTFQTADIALGANFSKIVSLMLAMPAELRYRKLLKDAGVIDNERFPMRAAITDRKVEGIINSITGVDFKNKDRLLAAYLGSVIPHYYINSKPNRHINPKLYPG